MPGTPRKALSAYRIRDYPSLMRRAAARFRRPRLDELVPGPPAVAEPWTVDRVEVIPGRVAACGWSLPATAAHAGSAESIEPREFRLNGRRFDEIRYPTLRPEVGEVFWQRRLAEFSGFECETSCDSPYVDGVMQIERVRPGADAVDVGRDRWFVPDPKLHADLPDEDRRFRVIGNRDPDGFLITGATDYHRLDHAIRALSGRSMHDFPSVLDWGSGCGRLARHFPRHAADRLTGCDIDHDNVSWCNAHLPGRFVQSAMTPPLPFGTGTFDLVYGVSVFTHLREPLQLRWLDELARVVSRGALLLMTVHGRSAMEFARLSQEEYARLRTETDRAGLLVTSANSQIDGFADHGGEYVNVFHSEDYIRRAWSTHFDVVRVVPGYIFTHDLVVLRRR